MGTEGTFVNAASGSGCTGLPDAARGWEHVGARNARNGGPKSFHSGADIEAGGVVDRTPGNID